MEGIFCGPPPRTTVGVTTRSSELPAASNVYFQVVEHSCRMLYRKTGCSGSVAASRRDSEIDLAGKRVKARSGERSTLDVLDTQQDLVEARVALVTTQHDRVVVSYALLATVGELNLQKLGFNCRSMVR
jgi:hypothetical protein